MLETSFSCIILGYHINTPGLVPNSDRKMLIGRTNVSVRLIPVSYASVQIYSRRHLTERERYP